MDRVLQYGIGHGDDLKIRLRRKNISNSYPEYNIEMFPGVYYLGYTGGTMGYLYDEEGVIITDEDDIPIEGDPVFASLATPNEYVIFTGDTHEVVCNAHGTFIYDLTENGAIVPDTNFPTMADGVTTGRLTQLPVFPFVENKYIEDINDYPAIRASFNVAKVRYIFNITTNEEIPAASCSITDNIIILPTTIDTRAEVAITYEPTNSFAIVPLVIQAGETYTTHYTLSGNVTLRDTITFKYQAPTKTDWITLSGINMYPLISGMTSGFLFIADTEQVVGSVRFNTDDGGYTTERNPTIRARYSVDHFVSTRIAATILDEIGNPVYGANVIWRWKAIDGDLILKDFLPSDDVIYSSVTDYSGTTSIILGSEFLGSVGAGLDADDKRIQLFIYDQKTNALISSDAHIVVTREAVDTRTNNYLQIATEYLYSDDDGDHYSIATWEEGLDSGSWQRLNNAGLTVQFKLATPDGKEKTLSSLVNGAETIDIPFSFSFPYTAYIADAIIDKDGYLYIQLSEE